MCAHLCVQAPAEARSQCSVVFSIVLHSIIVVWVSFCLVGFV